MADMDLTAPMDGCPTCTARDNPPLSATNDGAAGVTALYRCRACLHSWTTSWASQGWGAA